MVSHWYTIDQCRKNPDSLFIFGDNLERIGMGGQAIIREQPNAIGIATKKSISEVFTDEEYENNCKLIDEDIARVINYYNTQGFSKIVFPFQGLGTGLASLQLSAPKTLCYLTVKLLDTFQFNNLAALKSKNQL